jgi:triosephosphate isomerase (TIM)
MAKRTPFVCGNWKMHLSLADTRAQVAALVQGMGALRGRVDVAVAPVAPFLAAAVEAAQGKLWIAAQNVHFAGKGAFTGEWTVAQLKDIGVTHAIVGHSERRQMFAETDEAVAKKVRAVLDGGLMPIACVGEQLQDRERNCTNQVITTQVQAILSTCSAADASKLVIAYEPVWAIGTGKTASAAQAQEVHALIRQLLRAAWANAADDVRLQYGGSVKPDNAAELMSEADVDGALVGGASLEHASLLAIAKAAA